MLGFQVKTASFLVLPVVAITVGRVRSYGLAGAGVMPVVFVLRHEALLHGLTFHGGVLAAPIFASLAMSFLIAEGASESFSLTLRFLLLD